MQKKVMLYTLILLGLMFIIVTTFAFYSKYKFNSKKQINASQHFNADGIVTFKTVDDIILNEINIQLANTPQKRAIGLMHRKNLPANNGMLFVFKKEQDLAFWMKNTLISLDMIYINKNKEVVYIAYNTTPKSEQTYPSTKPAQYVVEVNAGFCEKYDIKIGTKVNWSLHN